MRITSAPPAKPLYSAIQPAWRPITSTTITRSWLSAVVCRRSMASVAICTAVWKPNVKSVAERSLSIVLGTPTIRTPIGRELVRDPEGVLATDRDHRVDALGVEVVEARAHTVVGVVGLVRDVPRIVPPRAGAPRCHRRDRRPSPSISPRHPWRKPTIEWP